MAKTIATIGLIVALLAPAVVNGQAPAPSAPPAAQPPAAAAAAPLEPPAGFTYDPEGRRDPFQSLLGRGNEGKNTGARPSGVAGLLIAEVTVKGIVRDRGGFIAMIQSPESKTYIVRAGAKLFDGSVKTIVADKVIFSQDVNDPLSLVKHREIPKAVRPDAGGTAGGLMPRE